jgi:fatty-acid desaturase
MHTYHTPTTFKQSPNRYSVDKTWCTIDLLITIFFTYSVHLSGGTNSDEDSDLAGIFEPTEQGVVLEGKIA